MNKAEKYAAMKLFEEMGTGNCMDLAGRYNARFDAEINWHEFSNILDGLNCRGIVAVVQGGGYTVYKWAVRNE